MLIDICVGKVPATEMLLPLASVCTPGWAVSVDIALVDPCARVVIATGRSTNSRDPLVSATLEVIRNAGADASQAASLVESALDVVETYLLQQVLKKSYVKDREHWQLALALFREFDQSVPIDNKLDRIATLIDRLGDLVVLTEDGTYDYTESVPPLSNVRALRA